MPLLAHRVAVKPREKYYVLWFSTIRACRDREGNSSCGQATRPACRLRAAGSGRLQVPVEERQRALPRELGGLRVVLQDGQVLAIGRLVRERMLGIVAMELQCDVGVAQLLLERVGAGDGEHLVARGP